MFKKLWKRLFTQSPVTPESPQIQSFILEPILTPSGLIDAGDDLPDPTPVELPEVLSALHTGEETPTFESGYFTVGDSGEVEIDFLFDGGKYKFELGIFSLEGLDAEPGSEEFIEEAARRSLSDSELGHVVLFDQSEGAKFEGDLGEAKNWNKGDYQGLKTVQMRSGEQFGIMLVPNGTVEDVYENPSVGGAKQPLFSLSTANPDDTLHLGQIADVTGDGNTFVMEDVRFDHSWYDQDYNDLIFQVRGATGKAELLDNLIEGESDWRETDLGQAIIDYTEGYVGDDPLPNRPDSPPEIPQENQPLIGMISTGVNENNPDIDQDRLILGKDYIDGDDNPLLAEGEGNEAGTHQLGIIAATQDNEIGIDGINDETSLWVSRSDGETWINSLQDFIETAKTSESPNAVVNIGFPIGDGLTPEMQDTLNTAREEGVLIVIPDAGQTWPDTYDNVIVVGSTGDDVSGGDILAEGGSEDNPVVSTVGEDMGTSSGTSVAASQVTGMVSQVWGANPGLSSQQIVEIIQQTATEVDGEGVINVAAAIHLAQATEPDFTDLLPIVEIDDEGEPLVVEDVRRPNFLPDELRLISDRFYNPTESVSVVGKVQDLDGIEDLQQIDFWLQKDGGEWVNVSDATEFTPDPYSEDSYRFSQNWGTLDPGNYRIKGTALDGSQVAWETQIEEFTVLSVPEGQELSDRVKTAIHRSENLHNYNPDPLSHTTEWVVSVQAGQSPQDLATQFGGEFVKATGHIPNTYIWKFPQGSDPHEISEQLHQQKGIEFAYPLVNVAVDWMSPKDEPLYDQQWHLHSDSFPDANISNVWDNYNLTGEGVVLGVVDNGFEIDDPNYSLTGHPDLLPNYLEHLSYDFDEDDPYGSRWLETTLTLNKPSQPILDEGFGSDYINNGYPEPMPGLNYYKIPSQVNATVEDLQLNLKIEHSELETLQVELMKKDPELGVVTVPVSLNPDGTFQGTLEEFKGMNAQGDWQLKITDSNINNNPDNDNSDGVLQHYSLDLKTLNSHGTKVAGVAISDNNNQGGTGIAPNTQWAGLRMGADGIEDQEVADVFAHKNQEIDIYNNSWGLGFFNTLDGDLTTSTPALGEASLEKAVETGRDGLGNIFVMAGGNNGIYGGNVNYNSLANSRQSIAVAALDHTGKQAKQVITDSNNQQTLAAYSESGASLLVSAYSQGTTQENGEYSSLGITTPSLYSDDGDNSNDYTEQFGGTSASAPFVSGVVALMLEANPNLTWRDIQHILVETAQKNDSNDPDWEENGAGYSVNHKYGFGAVDAEAAVSLAQNWTPLNQEEKISAYDWISEDIPDNGDSLNSTITIPAEDNVSVEWAEVVFNGESRNLGDLEIVLTSPDGTKSILAQQHTGTDAVQQDYELDDNTYNWVFTSARHWGEDAIGNNETGEWTLTVTDQSGNSFNNKGYWTDWKLNLYGTKPNTPPEIDDLNHNQTYTEDTPLTLTPITITDADGDNITVVLTLSDPNVGSLVTGTETSKSEGVLTLTGTPEEVTQALGNLQFNPAPNYNGDFEITTSVTDGNLATPILDKIYITGLAVNDAPTLTDVHLTGATEVQPFEISYEDLLAASGASDVEGDAISLILDTVENGTLTKDGVPVIPGETMINPGDTVVWTPDTAGDTVTAFNLSATDGEDVSDAVAVTVEVAAQPTVTITPILPNASEDGIPAVFNITRQNGNLSEDLTVNLDISGTAINGEDYQPFPSTVTIPANLTSSTLIIQPIDDNHYEGTETVVIGLGEGDYGVNSDPYTFTITDNDPNLPQVTLRATDAGASEDGNAAQFVVERTGDTNEALTVEYSLAGEAVNGEDYLPLTNTVTIPAGATTATIPVVPYHDYDSETEETVVINLTNAATYAVGSDNSATATIENSTRTSRYGPFVYVNPDTGNQYILSEKDTWLGAQEQAEALGGNLVAINDQAENDWLYETFGIGRQWIGLNDSEIYGNTEGNYRWVNGEKLTFTPNIFRTDNVQNTSYGEDFFETNFQGIGNWNDMPSELEILGEPWTNPLGIIEIDPNSLEQPIVNFMVTDDEAGEDGNAGQVVVTRVGNLDEDLTINYSLSGDAENGIDYQVLSETVVIPAGQSLATIPINSLYDGIFQEGEETVTLTLTAGEYEIGTHGTSQVKINENHTPFNPEWVKQWGTVAQDRGFGLTSDAAGNVYVIGSTEGDLDENTNAGLSSDPFMTKYNNLGQKVWTKQLGTTGYDYYTEIAVDENGNIFALGYGDGVGTQGGGDHKLVKWDSEGNLLWDKYVGTSDKEFSSGLKIDPDGNVILSGWTEGNFGATNQGNADAFVAKYDTEGNEVWIQQQGTTVNDRGRNIAVDQNGNIYLVGMTEGSLAGANAGESDIFVTKYDSSGNQIWTEQFGTDGTESPGIFTHGFRNVSVDLDETGNLYIAAETNGALEGHENQGVYDAIIFKLNPEGNTLWTQQFGDTGSDRATGIRVDHEGNFYLSGWTNGSIDGQPRLGHAPFLAKFDSEGNKIWTTIYGTSDAEEVAYGIEIDGSSNIYTTGYTTGNFGSENAGDKDIWLAKFPVSPIVSEPTIYTNPETGNKYFLTTPDTWLGAQEQAEALGGNLVTVNDASEQQWLMSQFGSNSQQEWIGITDSPIYNALEGNHKWVNDEAVNYTNWYGPEPNNILETPEGEDFGVFGHTGIGQWNDLPSNSDWIRQGIVEIPADAGYNWTWTYFGEDLHTQGNDIRLDSTPNTDAAKADFLANLNNIETVNFENFNDGDQPTTLDFGSTKATLTGHAVIHDIPTTTNGGMFPTSGDKFLGSYNDTELTLEFDNPQSAFGFTVTDAEGGPFTATLHHEDGTTSELKIPLQGTWPQNSGSALFYGITDIQTPFTGITIHKPGNTERIGLDDLIIGDLKPEVLLNTTTPPNQTLHLAYHEDTPLNLSDILVTDPDGEATVKLTLSDPNAGQLTTATSGNVTSTYDAATGVWTATGAVSDLNTLLANLEFNPATNSSSNLEIASEITVGTGTPLTGTITLTGLPEKTQFFTPDTPYLSFDDSPFKDESFSSFYLETFEDGQLNTPGLAISTGLQIDSISNPTSVDSVDGDDGAIDGSGLGGSSWYVFGAQNFTVTFDQETLGQLPTHAGFALTDLGRSDTTNLGSGRVIFEALDVNGQSLGTKTIDYGDNHHGGGTSEDRFLGVSYEKGISTLKISLPDENRGGEIDHIQYGVA
ncbi:S8 family serine peptidase [Spirulina sp. CS-785/01]|uniref:S8 family serine peptidase n=1 Tax=Spirulina sp. CS-785/01 TaxID=3021716 RepID=UPI0023305B30|nr:S8 family serine peptidase [Spirulina sp. CS-785/01]MDB9315366.1 S8 family serine peptidase [Spirulina sp. CS-785/01]